MLTLRLRAFRMKAGKWGDANIAPFRFSQAFSSFHDMWLGNPGFRKIVETARPERLIREPFWTASKTGVVRCPHFAVKTAFLSSSQPDRPRRPVFCPFHPMTAMRSLQPQPALRSRRSWTSRFTGRKPHIVPLPRRQNGFCYPVRFLAAYEANARKCSQKASHRRRWGCAHVCFHHPVRRRFGAI